MTGTSADRRPRVLVLGIPAFNRIDGAGITLSNLFLDWPRERLAMIHGESGSTNNEICDAYYRLTGREIRRLGPLLGMRSSPPAAASSKRSGNGSRGSPAVAVRRAIFGNMLPDSGRFTKELERWIAAFKPTVLYTVLGSNAIMDLALAIRGRFSTKLVLHFMDDWPAVAYRGGLASFAPRNRMTRLLHSLVESADLRLGISPAMCDAYEMRFGRSFEPFMNAVDLSRYAGPRPDHQQANELLYVGSIYERIQLGALLDCCRAVALLRDRGVRLTILTSAEPLARYRETLSIAPNITVAESPPDGPAFVDRIRSASALLLPVNFNRDTVTFIRYSMPTKVPAYLASGTPILAYGPPDVAQFEYARDEGWALVVNEQNPATLRDAIVRILIDEPLRTRLSAQAVAVAAARHSRTDVRDRFHAALSALG